MSLKRVVLIAALLALVTPAAALADGITFVFFGGNMYAVQPVNGPVGTSASNAFAPATIKYVSRFSGSTVPGGSNGSSLNNGNLPPQIAPTFGSGAGVSGNTFNFGTVSWTTGLANSAFVGANSSSATYDAGGTVTVTGNGTLPGTSNGASLFSGSFTGPTTLASASAPAAPNCTTCTFWYTLSGQVAGTIDPALMTLLGLGSPNTGAGLFFSFVVGFNGANDTIGNVEGGNISVVVPEPGTLALFGTGLISIAGFIRRRIKI